MVENERCILSIFRTYKNQYRVADIICFFPDTDYCISACGECFYVSCSQNDIITIAEFLDSRNVKYKILWKGVL